METFPGPNFFYMAKLRRPLFLHVEVDRRAEVPAGDPWSPMTP